MYQIYAVNSRFETVIRKNPEVFCWLYADEEYHKQAAVMLELMDAEKLREYLKQVYEERSDIVCFEGTFQFMNRLTHQAQTMRIEKDHFLCSSLDEYPFLEWIKKYYSCLIALSSAGDCSLVK